MRELRSHNSWMHNAPLLMRGGRTQALRIHPDDAERAGLADGDRARIVSASGSLEVPVMITDEMTPGNGRAAARLGSPGRLAAGERERAA